MILTQQYPPGSCVGTLLSLSGILRETRKLSEEYNPISIVQKWIEKLPLELYRALLILSLDL